jgi:hypothetical protein
MATGFPAKANYATGDILTATNMNDLAGTLNLVTTSTLSVSAGKNAVINGGADIWQRGTSIAIAASAGASSSTYTADRWQTSTGANQAITVSRQATGDSTNLPNIQYALRYQRNSGQTGTGQLNLAQNFETVNSIPFAGKSVTLSFYARAGANFSASGSSLAVTLYGATSTDGNVLTGGFTGATTPISSSATLTTTWQRFTYTGTFASNITQLAPVFGFTPVGTASTNDYYEITGVQLEVGSSATSFARNGATYQGELAACQRYYIRFNAPSGSSYGVLSDVGAASSTTVANCPNKLPVQLRGTISAVDYSTLAVWDGVTVTAVTGVSLTYNTLNSAQVDATTGGVLVQYRPYRIIANNSTSSYLGFSAEL